MPSLMGATTPWYWETFDLFDDVEPAAAPDFALHTARQRYAKGDYIFMAHDLGRRVFVLREGTVKIFHLSSNGTQTIFWFCVPGDVFGAGGISGAPHQAVYAQTVEPSVVDFISRADFEKMMKKYPQIAINMVRHMSGRLRLACDSMVDISEHKAESRLARVLLRLAHSYGRLVGDQVELRVRVSNQELADMIGTTRQTINALLHEFLDNGWLAMNGRAIVIVSPGDLQRAAEMGRDG
jgi:CRP/FNR family cyclic AMP-dependent transcriptional regulator